MPYLEDRVEQLERENLDLKQRIARLENRGADRFVTTKELAEMFKCSKNTIYVKIRSGEIYATRRAGDVRIPMSQFYENEAVRELPPPPERKKDQLSMKEKVFG